MSETYPKYYNVDEVPVILELDKDGQIVGMSANGKPFPVGKAIVEGYKIDKAEYNTLAQNLYVTSE